MRKLDVVFCSWKSPELLALCIDSLRDSLTVDASIKVVLNEGDKKSCEILCDHNIEFFRLDKNLGTLSVDFLINSLNSEYWCAINDDMYFVKGWDQNLISIIESFYPCSASTFYVEPIESGNFATVVDDLGPFTDPLTRQKFEDNYKAGKYKLKKKIVSYIHPIMVKTNDYFDVGGFSNGFDTRFFPGYGLDDHFCWRLWKKHNGNFRFISSDTHCVYHAVSLTGKKLSPEIKARSGQPPFYNDTGMTIGQFRDTIGVFSPVD